MMAWRRALAALTLAVLGCDASANERADATQPGAPHVIASEATTDATTTPIAVSTAAAPSDPSATSVVSASTAPAKEPAHVTPTLAFLDWVVSHCEIDALGPSQYTMMWMKYPKPPGHVGPKDPQPLEHERAKPREGSQAAKDKANELRAAWLANPESHVVDCTTHITKRLCKTCTDQPIDRLDYVAYLPKALFERPEKVRAMLLLSPGGRGARSRPFLRAIPGRSIMEKGSGGLDTKRLADAFYEEHPDANATIIVALATSGIQMVNGSIEHLTYDVPEHIAKTFMPDLPFEEVALGAEGVSSGAREIVRAAYAKPDAFSTIGLSCMSCGAIDPQKEKMAMLPQWNRFAKRLAERKTKGLFDVNFTIGGRDGQKPCNRRVFELFRDNGLFPPGDESAFTVFPGKMHDYAFLREAYPPALVWHLDKLDHISRTKQGLD
ncbi:MAG: hypothetical protein U0271_48295 [Polyangiaceae bacterium]